jgi:hypothetical protein
VADLPNSDPLFLLLIQQPIYDSARVEFANYKSGFSAGSLLKTDAIVCQRCMMSIVFGADGFGSMRSSRVKFLPRIRSS